MVALLTYWGVSYRKYVAPELKWAALNMALYTAWYDNISSDASLLHSAVDDGLPGSERIRTEQLDIVESLLSGKDIFLRVPTRFAKSLVYQLLPFCTESLLHNSASLCHSPLVILISPLLSLMYDQVVKFVTKGVKAQNFRHIKVPNSPGWAIFSIVPSYLCLVFRGIVSVSGANCTALHATYVHSQEIASPARSPGSSPSAQFLPSADMYHTRARHTVRRKIFATEKFRELLPNKIFREGASDTLHSTITWLVFKCEARRIFDGGWILSIIRRRGSLADTWLFSFSKRLTGAAHFFQEGTCPASFNSNRVDIAAAWLRTHARLLFLLAATFIASTL